MSGRRIGILLGRELRHGSRSFMVLFALLTPILLTVVINLVFGNLFSEQPRLGVVDEGNSMLPEIMAGETAFVSTGYATAAALEEAVAIGAEDFGLVLPAGFDDAVAHQEMTEITAFVWGESLARDRMILSVALANSVREVTGVEPPVEMVTTVLGDTELLPLSDRLLPLIILIAVFMGGMMAPATSLVEEKQKRTLTALTTTPATLGEVFVVKGFMGALMATIALLLSLAFNQAWGPNPVLLVFVLFLGGVFAAVFGLVMGMLTEDVTSLFAIIKGIGLLIYAPAFFYLFPQLPQWIARLFPTYYIMQPVMDITQQGAGFSDILPNLLILVALLLMMVGILAYLARRTRGTGRAPKPAPATS